MTNHSATADRLQPLLSAMLDGQLTGGQITKLRRLLRTDPAARRQYVRQVNAHVMLQWMNAPPDADGGQPASSIPPIILNLSPDLHSPLFTLRSPVGGLLFSYSMASLSLALVLLVAWTWKISVDREIPQVVLAQAVPGANSESPIPTVGRITGVVECRWADSENEAFDGDSVSLGRKLALASGFLEITYDTGAKVILHGPCRYEVESSRGGFLSLGRLTARVEAKKGTGPIGRNGPSPASGYPAAHQLDLSPFSPRGSEAKGERTANPPLSQQEMGPTISLAPRPLSLFSVRTPTAVVTDLGTEFGVEVDRSGASRAHVFQGKIEFRSADDDKGVRIIQLGANESARAEIGANRMVAVFRGEGPSGMPSFVCRMPKAAPIGQSNAAVGSASAPSYRLTDLGTLGGASSHAYGINAAGQVVGHSTDASGATHAFLYRDGTMKRLGSLGGDACAHDINAKGQAAGYSITRQGPAHAFLYSPGGVMKDLGTLGGAKSCAYRVNDRGQVAGHAQTARGATHAFLYDDAAGMKDLGTLGGDESYAYHLNEKGQVVGNSALAGNAAQHAFLYASGAGMKDLGSLGGSASFAFGVNAAGQVVGCSSTAGDDLRTVHAFLYDSGAGMKDLGTLDGSASCAMAVNAAGDVVGYSGPSEDNIRAFLYSRRAMRDLNSLVSAPGWLLTNARAINDSGQIAGFGRAPDGHTHAFLLTPVSKTLDTGPASPSAASPSAQKGGRPMK